VGEAQSLSFAFVEGMDGVVESDFEVEAGAALVQAGQWVVLAGVGNYEKPAWPLGASPMTVRQAKRLGHW
jgi:hypothetical protein